VQIYLNLGGTTDFEQEFALSIKLGADFFILKIMKEAKNYEKSEYGRNDGILRPIWIYISGERNIWRVGKHLGLWPAGYETEKQY
jgi:hypothetical protein